MKKLKEKILDLKKSESKTEPGEFNYYIEQNNQYILFSVKSVPKKRKRVDFSAASVERNFITPVRAMSDFLLKPSDLESLPKTKRRSPYECEPPITVYWRKDVEAKALEVWGSKENLLKECLKRDIERKKYQQSNDFFFKFRVTMKYNKFNLMYFSQKISLVVVEYKSWFLGWNA